MSRCPSPLKSSEVPLAVWIGASRGGTSNCQTALVRMETLLARSVRARQNTRPAGRSVRVTPELEKKSSVAIGDAQSGVRQYSTRTPSAPAGTSHASAGRRLLTRVVEVGQSSLGGGRASQVPGCGTVPKGQRAIHVPARHSAVPPVGGMHAFSHRPQWPGSDARTVHTPEQRASPGPHDTSPAESAGVRASGAASVASTEAMSVVETSLSESPNASLSAASRFVRASPSSRSATASDTAGHRSVCAQGVKSTFGRHALTTATREGREIRGRTALICEHHRAPFGPHARRI